MAILDAVPGLTVNLCSDGVNLREHPDRDDEEILEDTITRYIEIQPDIKFVIAVKFTNRFRIGTNRVRMFVHIDGSPVAKWSYRSPFTRRYEESGIETEADGSRFLRPFAFGSFETSMYKFREQSSTY
jgi:hypothetical protein